MTGIGNPDSAACVTNVGFSNDYELQSTVTSIQQIKATYNGVSFWIKFTLSNGEPDIWVNQAYGDVETGTQEETWDFTEDKPFIGLFGYKTDLRMTAFGPLTMERTLCKASEIENVDVKYDNVAWNE